MGDTNKNGYEIRESLLGLAVGILQERNSTLRENEYLKPQGSQNGIEPYSIEKYSKQQKLYILSFQRSNRTYFLCSK